MFNHSGGKGPGGCIVYTATGRSAGASSTAAEGGGGCCLTYNSVVSTCRCPRTPKTQTREFVFEKTRTHHRDFLKQGRKPRRQAPTSAAAAFPAGKSVTPRDAASLSFCSGASTKSSQSRQSLRTTVLLYDCTRPEGQSRLLTLDQNQGCPCNVAWVCKMCERKHVVDGGPGPRTKNHQHPSSPRSSQHGSPTTS